jgi:hypothetical protein
MTEKTYDIPVEKENGYIYWDCPICHNPHEEDRNKPKIGETLFCLGCGTTFKKQRKEYKKP